MSPDDPAPTAELPQQTGPSAVPGGTTGPLRRAGHTVLAVRVALALRSLLFGHLRLAAVLAALTGVLAWVGFGHPGLSIPGHTKAPGGPLTIRGFFTAQELCVGGYYTQGTEVTRIQAQLHGHNVPLASTEASVTGIPEVDVCQNRESVDAIYDPGSHSVTVKLPARSLNYRVSLPPDPSRERITYRHGATADVSQMVGSLAGIVGINGIDDRLSSADDYARAIAEMQLMDRSVSECGPVAYRDFTRNRLIEANKKDILQAAHTFGITLDPNRIKVEPPDESPPAVSEYAGPLQQVKHASNVKMQEPTGAPANCRDANTGPPSLD